MVDIQEIARQIDAGVNATMTKEEIIDDLGKALWQTGILWDKASGVDAHKGPPARMGTANHHSMTYKLRKIAGYSYP